MKILITGCQGQVGQELMLLAQVYGCEAIGLDRECCDITNQSMVENIIQQHKPSVVINAAAYTAVDKAEHDEETAYAVNATAVEYLAHTCADLAIPLVHISTDYVFDGSKLGAYKEDDSLNPLSVYGKSKLAGEEAVRSICKKYYILRTSWVFSSHGNNFVKTMLRLGSEREQLGVVADQYGKPTSGCEIARVIYMMLRSSKEGWGTYHVAQPTTVSWYQFATAIFEEAKGHGYPLTVQYLNKLSSDEYPTAAHRPQNSELDCTKLERVFSLQLTDWMEPLPNVIKRLLKG